MPKDLDKHDLYEHCVQSPAQLVPMLRAMHAPHPPPTVGPASSRCLTLAEDFAGTAALSYLWADASPDHHAVATDLDRAVLMRRPAHPRVTRVVADVRLAPPPAARPHPAIDILFVGNFSIGYLHTRAELVAYLRNARARLAPGGLFLCDTYGGESAYILGEVHRDHPAPTPPGGRRIRYTWEQRAANPLTGMVTNALHFEIDRAGLIEAEFPDAFVYHWRLWSVPELLDAMHEAGFPPTGPTGPTGPTAPTGTTVYDKDPDATDDEGNAYMLPVTGDGDLGDDFIVYVTGRVSADA
ncbi:MAG: class I SAM-dependent methyltransferase [Planctomycetota bacterium]|nr:class I SAM-dependent methyltransferase [Planctomycetota bacterium]